MSGIQTGIELNDYFSGVLNNIVNSVNLAVAAMYDMQESMSADIDTSSIEAARDEINQAAAAIESLNNQTAPDIATPVVDIGNQEPISILVNPVLPEPLVENPEPIRPEIQPNAPPESVEIPVHWETDSLEVFTGTGMERFQQEIQSANDMLGQLCNTQDAIARQAYNTNLLPPEAFQNLNRLAVRIDIIRDRIQQIGSNPLNIGTDSVNTELEQLRAQLNMAVQEQNGLNQAIQDMDISSANEAYLQLSQTVSNTERYIRDNVDEQGRFNREIQEGVDYAGQLKSMIAGAVGAFVGVAGIKKAFGFVEDCTQAFNTQLNAETQLISVLANMLDADYVAQFELETTADTAGAISEINAIQNSVDEVVVPVSAESKALVAAFDQITAKASEIQSRGIYGDEAMIAAAAEFSTYFSDTDAIEMMMDTLSDYAMGMSGGGEVGSQQMVDYATNLGKIMSGAYDAMTKKGFELSDTQKAIIEGTATQEQIVSALGEEYLTMSQDMQAAAAISQVIEESWAGLYESMSNTPEGKIIQMTNAWGDMKEVIGGQLYPYVILFVDAITENWSTIEGVVQGITTGLEFLLGMLSWVLEAAISVADAIIENWSWISPIIYGIAAALAVYYGWQVGANTVNLISKGIHIAMAAVQMAHAAATGTLTAATAADIAAQNGLNAAMYACPIVWIIILVVALIAGLIALCNWIAKTTGVAQSGIGIIVGALSVAAAFIGNLFVALINMIIDIFVVLWNFIAEFVNFFGNVFTDPIGSIARLFFGLVDGILSLLQTLAGAIDAIFGSSLADAVQGWRDDLSGWVDDTFGKGEEVMAKVSGEEWHVDRFEYGEAWDAGVAVGDGIAEAIDNFSLSDLFGGTDGIPDPKDYTPQFEGMHDSLDGISDDTGNISDSLEVNSEELKYLRDLAEQETVNRYTVAEITIDQSGMQNTINNGDDIDGFMTKLTDSVNEAVDSMTEGVHE